MTYSELCVAKHKAHSRTRNNGDKLIYIEAGLWDIFYGSGWGNHSRFRIFQFRKGTEPRLTQLSGIHMPDDLRKQLLRELTNHG
jgi:hypothetical protein